MDILSKWVIPNDELCDGLEIIFLHGYGLTVKNELPESAKCVLLRVVEISNKHPEARILLASSDYFRKPYEYEQELKTKFLIAHGVDKDKIIDAGGVSTTLDEVLLLSKHEHDGEIVSICDRLHARRIRFMWQNFVQNPKTCLK